MATGKKKPKILDCKATDNEYLHKDFHGALCYTIKYLDENYGYETTNDYLKQVALNCYSPLIRSLKDKGLSALEKHWRTIFTKEDGLFNLNYENKMLVLRVERCPAISHLKKSNQLFTTRYCETTVVVNQTICEAAGYKCSCQYEPGEGKCVQKILEGQGEGTIKPPFAEKGSLTSK